MNLGQNKINSINAKKLRTSIDREIHKASNYNPTLDGLVSIDKTDVEKPFLNGSVNQELNLYGIVNNNSPIKAHINIKEEVLDRNNLNKFFKKKINEDIIKEIESVTNNLNNIHNNTIKNINNINKNVNKNVNNKKPNNNVIELNTKDIDKNGNVIIQNIKYATNGCFGISSN